MTAFSPRSRYAGVATRQTTLADGTIATLVDAPRRAAPALAGFHPRTDGQRPDHLAAIYLGEATAAWRLYDAGDGATPEALAARALIGVPRRQG